MISLFRKNAKLDQTQTKEVYDLLGQFYKSFFGDMYNELNIDKYRPIRDAIGLVMRKFDEHDHPLAYSSKLVMYIQAQVAMKDLPLTDQQQALMTKISNQTKCVNLSFVYTSPLNDVNQFMPSRI